MNFSYFIFAWIASLAFGLATIIGKLTSKYSISNPWLFTFSWYLLSFLLTVPIALFYQSGFPQSWFWVIVNGFVIALVNIFLVLAMYNLDVTILSPLFNFRTLFAAILAAIFFKEILTGWQYVLIIIIVIAGVFASIDEKAKLSNFFSKKILIGLICMLMLAISSLITKQSILINGYWTSLLWSGIFGMVFLIPTYFKFAKDVLITPIRDYVGVATMTLVGSVATLAANFSYTGNVTISTAIISLPISMFIAIALSRFNPKLLEKHSAKVYVIRLIAASVMILGAYKLN